MTTATLRGAPARRTFFKTTKLFAALTLALAAGVTQAADSSATFVELTGVTTLDKDTTYNNAMHSADTSEAGFTGATGEESLTFDYDYRLQSADEKSIAAIVHSTQGLGSFTLSNFSEIHFVNHSLQADGVTAQSTVAVGNYWGPNAITIKNTDLLSFGTEDEVYYGSAVQAIGGQIDIDVSNLYINAMGNGLYLQQNNKNNSVTNGNLNVKVAEALVVHTGNSPAVFVQSWGDGATVNPTLAVDAGTIDIASSADHAVCIQDYDQTQGAITSSTLSMHANGDISIRSDKRDAVNIVNQLTKGTGSADQQKSISISSETGTVTLEAFENGINVWQKGSVDMDKSVTVSAPKVSITGQVASIKAADKGHVALQAESVALAGDVSVSSASDIGFEGLNGGAAYVTLNGNLTADDTSAVSLTKTTLDLADGKKMEVSSLTGSEATIVLNNLANQSVTIGSNAVAALSVVASGTANDAYGNAQEAAVALTKATSVTNAQTGNYALVGREGAVSGGWTATVDAEGNTTVSSVSQNTSMAAIADFNAMTLAQWRGEINHLSQRLGDLRGHSTDLGVWARTYGYDASLSDTVSVDLKSNSIQIGADARVGGNWIVGGALSYTDQDADFSNGSGESDGYSLAAYAAGYFDCGGYVDVIGRAGRLSSDVTATSLSGSVFDGSYDNTALGLSVELGYRFNVTRTFYAEPQMELAYGFVSGDDYTSGTNGVRIEQDDFQSLVGRLGVRAGANFSDDKGTVYLHASVNHDFLGQADATATPAAGVARSIGADLGGTWVSYGIGLQYATESGLTVYGSLERANGNEYQENYRYNLGVRYNF